MSSCSESEPFALQVIDDSMEPEFPNGCVIIVEPGGVIDDGCFVVAFHADGVILRRLVMDDSGWRLVALKEGIEPIDIAGPDSIRGRVIQRAARRRRDRKLYI
ncbi:MAG: hypothetical protein DHS20C01_11880 [marine bacterium B5-7]|nr:MAG: hypothetical protein DHS20C01_11880 [marine bacterium B5-7]